MSNESLKINVNDAYLMIEYTTELLNNTRGYEIKHQWHGIPNIYHYGRVSIYFTDKIQTILFMPGWEIMFREYDYSDPNCFTDVVDQISQWLII